MLSQWTFRWFCLMYNSDCSMNSYKFTFSSDNLGGSIMSWIFNSLKYLLVSSVTDLDRLLHWFLCGCLGQGLLQQCFASTLHVHWLIHPGMCANISYCRSLAGVVTEHWQDEVFELGWQVLTVDFLPVLLDLACAEKVIEILFSTSFLEWENALNNNEKDNTHWENIDLSTIILLSLLDLRSHVGHGTSVRAKLVDVLVASEAEVSYL